MSVSVVLNDRMGNTVGRQTWEHFKDDTPRDPIEMDGKTYLYAGVQDEQVIYVEGDLPEEDDD